MTREDRFWSKVRKGDGCWYWTGYTTNAGYGSFYWREAPKPARPKSALAHRFAWTLAHGAIPPGAVVMHLCDNRLCVRQEHLRLGTQRENAHDAIAKGRMFKGPTGAWARNDAVASPLDGWRLARMEADRRRK